MKKGSFLLLAASILMAGMLSGCGTDNGQTAAAPETSQAAVQTEAEPAGETLGESGETSAAASDAETASAAVSEDESAESADAGVDASAPAGDTLVVYFSATGNTERVAQMIGEVTGGALFELEPVEPYTEEDLNYRDSSSRTSLEYADESLRDVELAADTVDGWADISTVYVGYPIWWGLAAWPVDTFVKANDFTGKTVIPFCTSGSSGIGSSGQRLEEMAGAGTWLEGTRFGSGVTEDEVQAWVESLGL